MMTASLSTSPTLRPPWDTEDADNDGLTNGQESQYGSSPYIEDSDDDGLTDFQEYTLSIYWAHRLDPWDTDTDNDGLSDYQDGEPVFPLDTDGDGITDILDPFPWDPTNDTSVWPGGTFLINGVPIVYGPTNYTTSQGAPDRDGDGIPDFVDPYPDDLLNYNQWWEGGTFRFSGVEHYIFGRYIGTAEPYDNDNDNIPNSLDPFPNDATNNTTLLASASRWINGTEESWGDIYYASNTAGGDTDNDGIPNFLDPHPNDATNNTSFWSGGDYWVSGVLQPLSLPAPYAYATSAGMGLTDADNDGIPDLIDPFLNDPLNDTAWWGGGTFWINGSQTNFAPNTYAYKALGGWSDTDYDGILDSADPYLNDGSNGTGYWGGGTFMISAAWVHYDEARWDLASVYQSADLDFDGIPDQFDPYLLDTFNNTAWWSGGTYWIDGEEQVLDGGHYAPYYGGSYTLWDADGDGIPDNLDPHASDSNNNTGWWWGGSFLIDGMQTTIDPFAYAMSTFYTDGDGDGIPDLADPYPLDAWNDVIMWVLGTNPFDGTLDYGISAEDWLDIWYAQSLEARENVPLYLQVGGQLDTDGDLIPDVMEDYFGMDSNDPGDALALSSIGWWTNLELYMAGQNVGNPWETPISWTGDLPNLWKIHHGIDPTDPSVMWDDPDEDGILTYDEYFHGTNPTSTDTDGDTFSDGLEIAENTNPIDPLSYPLPPEEPPLYSDTDGDGYTDYEENEAGTNPNLATSFPGSHASEDGSPFSPEELAAMNQILGGLKGLGPAPDPAHPIGAMGASNLEARWVEVHLLRGARTIRTGNWNDATPIAEWVESSSTRRTGDQMSSWSTSGGSGQMNVSWATAEAKLATLQQQPWVEVKSTSDLRAFTFQASGGPAYLNHSDVGPHGETSQPIDYIDGEVQRVRWIQVRVVTRGVRTQPLTYTQQVVKKERAYNGPDDETPEVKANTLIIASGEQTTAVPSTSGKTGTDSNGGIFDGRPAVVSGQESLVQLTPVDLFLDNKNGTYDPNWHALGVSNYVTTDELPATSGFDDECDDPKNFRFEAIAPVKSATSVWVTMNIKRDGQYVEGTFGMLLDDKKGDRFRSRFFRLVSDEFDDNAPGVVAQTIKVKLGDTIEASYEIPGSGGVRVKQTIDVGRPVEENYTGWSHKREDIREVKVNVHIMRRFSGSSAVIDPYDVWQHIKYADERFAQAGIRLKVVGMNAGGTGNPGIALPTGSGSDFSDGFDCYPDGATSLSDDEKALFALQDDDPNTIDIFYVDFSEWMRTGLSAISYPSASQFASFPKGKNLFVMDSHTATRLIDQMTLAHEVMHILANSEHRPGESPTGLLYEYGQERSVIDGPKRIGPNPESTTVGGNDNYTVRRNAETLP